jgi:hypothetical protein
MRIVTRLSGIWTRNGASTTGIQIEVVLRARRSWSRRVRCQVLKLGTEAFDRGRGIGVDVYIPRSSHDMRLTVRRRGGVHDPLSLTSGRAVVVAVQGRALAYSGQRSGTTRLCAYIDALITEFHSNGVRRTLQSITK